MPYIHFQKNRPPLEVLEGANMMDALLNAEVPVASSCHGDAVCGKCKVSVIEGAENLSPVTDAEGFRKERLKLGADIRLSCQAKVLGDIKIDTTYW